MLDPIRGLLGCLSRSWCDLIGHELSWTHAVAIGVTDHPVCKRCGRVITH